MSSPVLLPGPVEMSSRVRGNASVAVSRVRSAPYPSAPVWADVDTSGESFSAAALLAVTALIVMIKTGSVCSSSRLMAVPIWAYSE